MDGIGDGPAERGLLPRVQVDAVEVRRDALLPVVPLGVT